MTDPSAHKRIARVRDVFEDWAERGRAEGMEESHTPFVRPVFERLPLPPDGTYLDIGCGNGYTVRWAAAAAPEGRGDWVSPVDVAWVRIALEQPDSAFAWLERAVEQRDQELVALSIRLRAERGDPIRAEPRYADQMRRVGFDPAEARPR